MDTVNHLRLGELLARVNLHPRRQIYLLAQPSRLPTHILGSPAVLALGLALLRRHNSRTLINGHSEGGNDTLDDVVDVAALRGAGGELDHVALAQGVAGVRDEEASFLGIVFPDTLVPEVVAEGDGDGALHAPDRDDGAGFQA